MVTQRLAQAVREQLGLGRLLPLGTGAEPLWVTESAAAGALLTDAHALPGLRVTALRIGLATDGSHAGPAGWAVGVAEEEPSGPAGDAPGRHPARSGGRPWPPSALPPGAPLRLAAEFATRPDAPLPERASRLRATLARSARERIGLDLREIDLTVSGLLDEEAGPESTGIADAEVAAESGADGAPAPSRAAGDDHLTELTASVLRAVLEVPGVTRPAGVLGGTGRAVRVDDDGARLQLAVRQDAQVLDVAHRVRLTAIATAGTDRVAVLVTAIDPV
ncbi:hypothetical protein [Streptomyces otsuchiensis]|uniref:hypothetical protein n=1 Tax=Streptomyces otsuchiensis TaxID=2681388 RepID=UPI0010324D69|nr:hypothetical protein [Streptomyces otsuchiensis]